MLPNIRTATTAAVAALSIAATAAAPASAGQRERDFLKGVAATVIVGSVIQSMNNRAYAQPRYVAPAPQPQYFAPPREPVYYAPAPRQTVGSTAAAQAFRSYSLTERRAIQRELARAGYYYGSIDGVFGPATFRAVSAYAADRGLNAGIDSASGAYTVYDSLIY